MGAVMQRLALNHLVIVSAQWGYLVQRYSSHQNNSCSSCSKSGSPIVSGVKLGGMFGPIHVVDHGLRAVMSGLVPGLGQVGHQLTELLSAVVEQFRLLVVRDLSTDLHSLDWSQDSSLKKKDSGFFIKYKNLSII